MSREANIDNFTRSVHRNNYWNIILRGTGIILGLYLVRINISYLGATLYGLWVTIASISQWANHGDLGIGNGLRNELAKAVANDDIKRQLSLIKTAVIMLSKISLCLFVILTVISEMLIFTNVLQHELRVPLYITNAFFCVSFIFGISRSIAYSYQKSWYASLAQVATIALQIVGVLLLLAICINPSLIIFAIINGIGTVVGNLVICFGLYSFISKSTPSNLKIEYNTFYKHDILNVGIQFFVLQLCGLILYATDSVIINRIIDSASVAKYSVITQVYNTGDALFSLLLISLWSAVTYVAEKKNYEWIRNEVRSLLKMWLLYVLGVIVVTFLFNWVVKIWLGDKAFVYEPSLLLVFALFAILNMFGAIYVNVANGLGIIKLQIVCSIIGSIINIPLSIFLADSCELGLTGIKFATIICCFGSMFLVPIQIHRYLKNK